MPSYTYQWRRCNSSGASCSDIGGATSATYTLVSGDLGSTIRVVASDGTTSVTSNATDVIVAAPSIPSSYTPNKFFSGGSGTNIDSFLASLNPGDVAGLSGICRISASISKGGTAGNPIIVTSNDWANPATLQGRLAIFDKASMPGYWTFDYMYFDDNQTSQPTSWVVAAHHITFRRLACTNHRTHIGFNLVNDPVYGRAHDCVIERSRIYDIGPVAYDNRSHGIYNEGINNRVEDNVIYRCSARGIQDRAGTNNVYNYNVSADNRVGIIVGDSVNGVNGSHGLRGTKNIFAFNEYAAVRTYANSSGTDNVLDDNFEYQAGPDSSLDHLTNTNVHNQDPLFTNHAGHDYSLGGGSPAAGYGPRFSVGPT